MSTDSDILKNARKWDRASIEKLLQRHYPMVHRIGYALTGREDAGSGVVRFVMNRSLQVMGKWERDGTPERWFAHHTVLTTRRADKYPPDAKNDVLILHGGKPDAEYIAFVRAIRGLPQQQRESILLYQGEKMEVRGLAIAMDCSTEAAGNHLRAAENALRAITGDRFSSLLQMLHDAYRTLAPTEQMIGPAVRRFVRKVVWPRRIKRIFGFVTLLALLAGAIWVSWRMGLIDRLRVR